MLRARQHRENLVCKKRGIFIDMNVAGYPIETEMPTCDEPPQLNLVLAAFLFSESVSDAFLDKFWDVITRLLIIELRN